MNQTYTSSTRPSERRPVDRTASTRRLLACGVACGPMFVTTTAAQAITRDGYDLTRHPISMLSLGGPGWIQITNFVVAGLLSITFAAGMRRVLRSGRARTWGPVLLVVFGVGLLLGGVFVTDPAQGFPAGAPDGIPAEPSWHAMVHNVAPGLAMDALIVACLVFVGRFGSHRERRWQVYTAATAVALLGLTWWPSLDGISVRLAVAVTLAMAWTTAIAVYLLRRLEQPSG